jgi:hypothetical protein
MLVEHGVLKGSPLLTDCSDPRNLALLWLAEDLLEKTPWSSTIIRRFVLSVVFNSLGGLHWENNTRWLSSNHECEWYGIVCDEDHDILLEINLSANNLYGTIPPEVAWLSNLQALDLSMNLGIVDAIPQEFSALLEDLDYNVTGTSVELDVRL